MHPADDKPQRPTGTSGVLPDPTGSGSSPHESADVTQQAYPIVGIGTSAGGLDALSDLLAHLPANAGMALLVVQHLDRSHPSLLTDILAQRTPLAVTEATDGQPVEENHVYVIPPDTSMTLAQGRLVLRPRGETMGPPMPIDDMLDSLAKDQGSKAVGVILSGNGTDGAIGMQAIKGCGGIGFAQDDDSARFTSMPRAAVELGGVDLALPPAQIAAALLRLVRNPFLDVQALDADDRGGVQDLVLMDRVLRRLHMVCHVDFTHYKRGTVERRLGRRLALHGLDHLSDYLTVLEADPAEAHALCRDLLIRYTEFFRDPEAFAALSDTALPRLMQHGDPAMPLRIWVPGCATGEEVYSIAICVLEYLAEQASNREVLIFGTDVSEESLAVARSGRYIENIARNVSADRLARYFVRDGDHYRVSKTIRDCCTFARQNVAYDPPFSRIDLISCRNLLIYLDPTLQKRVMPAFHFALQREGLLMLGLSESVGAYSELFTALEGKRTRLFLKRSVPHRILAAIGRPTRPSIAPPPGLPRAGSSVTAERDGLRREIDRVSIARFAPPCVLCDDDLNVLEFRGDTSAFLSLPAGAPTQQLQRLARPGVFSAIGDAVRRARADSVPVRRSGLRIDTGSGQLRDASIEVVPLYPGETESRWFLVFFILSEDAVPLPETAVQAGISQAVRAAVLARLAGGAARRNDADRSEVRRLTDELRASREHTREMLEEHDRAMESLRALEEETQSSNEELQSTNEELETAKEELQSLNEELSTTNDELRFRNRELKVLHDEVTQGRDFADAIIETMSQPLLVLMPDLRVTRANQAFYACYETSPRETLHRVLYELGDGQWNIPALRELLETLVPRHTKVRDFEVSAVFPHIGARTVKLNAARVAWPDRALILLTIDDVTTKHRAFDRLTQADRQKDEFLAMLAHELRNPMAAMNNAMHVWRHEGADDALKQKAVATIERQLRNQARMVDDLLDVSRISRGMVTLHMELLDLSQIVQQAHDALRQAFVARRHEVTVTVPPRPVLINGDAVRLEQIVTNLIGNAIKYTPAGGVIHVSLQRGDKDAVLTVADNGIGMTEEFQSELFTVFVQADRSAGQNMGGLGIGLAVVRRLAELHGGQVTAFSAGLTHGSRFVVRLPYAEEETWLPDANPPPPVERGATTARRVLVVDDNVDASQSTAALLRLAGHEVQIADDGPSALEQVRSFQPDAVVLDIGLPGMNGYEVCRQLREMPGHEDTLVIAVSGYGQLDDVDRGREAGVTHYLTKPADPEELKHLLES